MAHRMRSPVVLTRYSSRPESLSYFLSELKNIRESQEMDHTETQESDSSDQDEDPNAEWLRKAGFENFVYMLENTQDDDGELNSSEIESRTAALPRSHAAAIRQRMHTLRSTIRSRQGRDKRRGVASVRDVFKANGAAYHASDDSPSVILTSIERLSSPALEPEQSSQSVEQQSQTSKGTLSPPTTPQRKPNSLPINAENKTVPELHIDGLPASTDIKLSCHMPSPHGSSEPFPSISIDPDPLGVTLVSDLSPEDMEKVRCLAHIELSITFDENGIQLRTLRPAKLKNINEEQLFGVPLSVLLQNDLKRDPKATIPLLLKEMVEYLEEKSIKEEGILRVPGSAQRIKSIKEELERTYNSGEFLFEGRKAADIASLLKQFLRDLPIPLLTREFLHAFASISDISDLKEQVRTLNLLVLMLPNLHQKVLKRLLLFGERIHQLRDVNKMDMTNISMVLAPNLFCSLPASKKSCDDVTFAAKTSHVLQLLVRYHDVLWMVPGGMLKQVRFLYEYELKKLNERSVRNALKHMSQAESPSTPRGKLQEGGHHIIRVKAPLFSFVCKAVNIEENPTAGTVIAKLCRRRLFNKDVIRKIASPSAADSSASDETSGENVEDLSELGEQFLHEVGGNIGERRLDNSTNMLALLQVNPQAQWIIKPRNFPTSDFPNL